MRIKDGLRAETKPKMSGWVERDPTQIHQADTKRLMDLEPAQAGAMKITPENIHVGYEGTTACVFM